MQPVSLKLPEEQLPSSREWLQQQAFKTFFRLFSITSLLF
jgi:hypothetical protein